MMKTPTVDGIKLDAERMTANRDFLILLRDTALAQSKFDVAVELSITIAFLAAAIENLK